MSVRLVKILYKGLVREGTKWVEANAEAVKIGPRESPTLLHDLAIRAARANALSGSIRNAQLPVKERRAAALADKFLATSCQVMRGFSGRVAITEGWAHGWSLDRGGRQSLRLDRGGRQSLPGIPDTVHKRS